MPGFVGRLSEITPTIILFGIILLNGYHHLDHLLVTNFVGGIYLAFINRGSARSGCVPGGNNDL
ncbi:hypothetical protein N7517_004036 [Penicillium concentricum]|uniref:Uncharacterized protein n=1 Tax=Penicillium concentricum TaxID=293559 RepID=A0A9W9S646_9EURO|nr:uncharacterized protein N7517_004036 [Penicillium concentricum]KAJ5372030.1 hypothetical protein N7517_004036 [Penicillium concentricum]